jgi:hypothetical protein
MRSRPSAGVWRVWIEVGYRIDMCIDQLVLVENKTVEKILPIHLAQLMTYLKLSGLSLGLIINWNVALLRDGIQRVVRNHPEETETPRAPRTPGKKDQGLDWSSFGDCFLERGFRKAPPPVFCVLLPSS